jgi:anaerobic magnesium-protoporphyrin IX monomethyl ester cyclase
MLEQIKNIPGIDVIVSGEGEETFTEILDRIERGEKLEKVYFGTHPDLDSLPPIDRDLFDASEEMKNPFMAVTRPPFITLMVGRGCPFKCSFCQPAERMVFGNKVRMRSVESVINELDMLYKRFRFNSFMVHDDLFTYNSKWIYKFCDEYEKLGIKKKYICQSRADIICNNEPMIKRMRESGLEMVLIGIESGSQRILDFLKKEVTVEQNLKAAEICKKYGIKIFANYMFGVPTETKEDVQATIKMMRKIDPEFHSPAFFTPHPGSELYEYCKARNLSLIKEHEVDRSPKAPKIKGIDYDYLFKEVGRLQKTQFLKKVIRKLKKILRIY